MHIYMEFTHTHTHKHTCTWNTHMHEIDTDIEQTYGTEKEERDKMYLFYILVL